MAIKTKIRMDHITGSVPTDTEGAAAASSLTILDLSGTLAHMASAIKRIHGASSFSEAAAGIFAQSLVPSADDTLDLGTAAAAWQDLHMEGDVLMTDAGKVSTAAGDLEIESAAGSVNINAAEAALDSIVLHAENAGGGIDMKVNSNVLVSMDADQVDFTSTAATVNVAGQLNVDATTASTSKTSGALVVDGGVGIAADLYVGDDLTLASDAAVLTLGSTSAWTLTDVASNNEAKVGSGHRLSFGDSGEYIAGNGTDLSIVSSNDIDVTGDMNVVGEVTSTKLTTLASAEGVTTIGSSNQAVFTAAGVLNINNTTNATSTTDGSLQTDGGLSVVLDAVIGDDLKLKSDSAELVFGAGDDVKLVHTNDTGLHLNAGMRLGFRDQGGEYIYSVADGTLGVVAATEIDLTATDIDINGAVDISGNLVVGGNLDINGTTTTIDTTNLSVEDSIIALGVSGSSGAYSTTGHRGILFPRGTAGSAVAGFWWDGSRFQLGLSPTGPTSGTFAAVSQYSKLMVERVEFDNANNYIELDTDVKIISAADVIVDPGGGELVLDGNLVSATDSSDDLGASGVAWNKLWVDEIDLNGQGDISMGGTGRIDLDADDDTSIRASADDVITFEAGASDRMSMGATALYPATDDGLALGSANQNWSDLFLADAAVLNFGDDQEINLTHVHNAGLLLNSAMQLQFGDSGTYVHQSTNGQLDMIGDVKAMITAPVTEIQASTSVQLDTPIVDFEDDGVILQFGDDDDVTLTHVHNTGLLLNAAMKLQFGDSGTNIQQLSDGILKLTSDNILELNADEVIVGGATPRVTIGDAEAEDTLLVFDGNAQDYRIGLDDGTDKLEFGLGAAHGSTTAFTIDSSHVTDFTAAKLSYGGTLIGSTAAELNLLDGSAKSTNSITIADSDALIVIDGSATKQIPASDLFTYLAPAKSTFTIANVLAADADFDTSMANVEAAANELVEVYINGMLLERGANDGAATDWYPGTSSGNIKFQFDLAVDDVIQVIFRKV